MQTFKPPLGLMPRHFWLRERVRSCIEAIGRIEDQGEWEHYRAHAKKLAEELLYCTIEWEKFYSEDNK